MATKNVGLPMLALSAVILIVTVVIGLYIVTQVESSMSLSGSNWYTPYNNFVTSMQTVFTLLGIAVLVIVAAFILGIYTWHFNWLIWWRRS